MKVVKVGVAQVQGFRQVGVDRRVWAQVQVQAPVKVMVKAVEELAECRRTLHHQAIQDVFVSVCGSCFIA